MSLGSSETWPLRQNSPAASAVISSLHQELAVCVSERKKSLFSARLTSCGAAAWRRITEGDE